MSQLEFELLATAFGLGYLLNSAYLVTRIVAMVDASRYGAAAGFFVGVVAWTLVTVGVAVLLFVLGNAHTAMGTVVWIARGIVVTYLLVSLCGCILQAKLAPVEWSG